MRSLKIDHFRVELVTNFLNVAVINTLLKYFSDVHFFSCNIFHLRVTVT